MAIVQVLALLIGCLVGLGAVVMGMYWLMGKRAAAQRGERWLGEAEREQPPPRVGHH
jgi:uncharacterized iron-regulated membrane protein